MVDEKVSNDASVAVSNDGHDSEHIAAPLPTGWKYRERRIGGISLPFYASPKIQLVMVAFVCFLCPGMFNALGGLGGGGKADHTLADNMVSWNSLLSTLEDQERNSS